MHNLTVFAFGFLLGGGLVGTYHLWKARAWAEALKLSRQMKAGF